MWQYMWRTCEHVSRQCRLWSFFQCALDLRGSVGFICRWILRLSSIILNSPFEYDVILTFVGAHEELVYFIRSWVRSPKTGVIPGLYFSDCICWFSCNCNRKGQSYPVEYLESVEEYSEPGNGNVNTFYFLLNPQALALYAGFWTS